MGGELLSTPPLPAGWRVVGSFSERLGETELFLQSDSGLLGMWVFSGRTFQYGVSLNPGIVSDPNWKVRAVGDFNHDGHGDLVWQDAPTGLVAIWFMNGSDLVRTWTFVFPGPPGPDWEIFGTGDSDFNGELDFYWQHRTTGTLAVWQLWRHLMELRSLASRVLVFQSQRSRLARRRPVRSRSRRIARYHLSTCPVGLSRGVVSEWSDGPKQTLLESVERGRLELEAGGTAVR